MDKGCDLSDARLVHEYGLPIVLTRAGAPDTSKDDCGVRALAISLGISYQLAENICQEWAEYVYKKWGKTLKSGVFVGSPFFRWLPVKFKRYVRNPIRIQTFLARYPTGVFYLLMRDHACAVINGLIYDWSDLSPNKLVKAAWSPVGIKSWV